MSRVEGRPMSISDEAVNAAVNMHYAALMSHESVSDYDAMEAAITAALPFLLAEKDGVIERLRATNTALNRRATKAEGQVTTTIEDCRRQGVSIGRGLANAGYEALAAERDALLTEIERLTERSHAHDRP